jgi:hypothetical protein
MSNTNQPESAFPSTFKSLHPEEQQVHRWGMTLRDYFAAKAMQALITGTSMWREEEDIYLARVAYGLADTMLEAREE